MATKNKAKSPQKMPAMGEILVGKCFHIFGENQQVQYQGIVLGLVNSDYALVQYYEWFIGEPNTLEVIAVERMSWGATANHRELGSWQFYENNQHMHEWYENHSHASHGSGDQPDP